MLKTVAGTAALLAAALAFADGADAVSRACQTVNGRTTCLEGPGTLSCRTVGGRTTCTAEPAPSGTRSLRPAVPPPDPDRLVEEALRTLPPGLFDGDGSIVAPGVRIERGTDGLRVQTPGLDLNLD